MGMFALLGQSLSTGSGGQSQAAAEAIRTTMTKKTSTEIRELEALGTNSARLWG
jgi:hypothetical protein